MKTCSQCGVSKPLGDFYPRATSPDGHRNNCRQCQIKRSGLRRLQFRNAGLCIDCGGNLKKDESSRCERCTGIIAVGQRRHTESLSVEQRAERSKRNRDNYPPTEEAKRRYYLKTTYGLTAEVYQRMLVNQEYKCPICGELLGDNVNVDHDHTTGRVRGVVHPVCNTLVGILESLPTSLVTVLDYIHKRRRRRISIGAVAMRRITGHRVIDLTTADPEWAKLRHRWRKYGITPEDYNRMLLDQKNRCALCSDPLLVNKYVDHCHHTGVVRGIIHPRCNNVVGWIEQYKPALNRALVYIGQETVEL